MLCIDKFLHDLLPRTNRSTLSWAQGWGWTVVCVSMIKQIRRHARLQFEEMFEPCVSSSSFSLTLLLTRSSQTRVSPPNAIGSKRACETAPVSAASSPLRRVIPAEVSVKSACSLHRLSLPRKLAHLSSPGSPRRRVDSTTRCIGYSLPRLGRLTPSPRSFEHYRILCVVF